MKNEDSSKEQLIEQIKLLQEKISGLEKSVSAHSHTEDALKTSEDNLSAILEKNADGILIVDMNGIVLYVNRAGEKLFGRSKEDFLGYEFGFPVSIDNEIDTLTIRKGETLCEVALRIVKIKFQSQPAYQLSIRDVTERQLAEKALKESEEKCRVIFDNANDGMFLVDLETRKFFTCNVSCAQMLGYEQEEFAKLEIVDIHFEEDLTFINEQIEVFNQGLESIRLDLRFKRKNGDVFYADVSPTFLTIGDKNYLLVVFRDMTERRQMEKELIESEKKTRSILENSADAIFFADDFGNYTYTNKKVTAMLGFTQEEMLSKTIIDMAPKNKVNEYLEIFKRLKTDGKLFTEIELLKNDGSYIATDLNATIMPDGLVFASCRDITERKHAEEVLVHAKNKAEESDHLKTAFLHNVSHEIRTPMNAIVGFSGLLNGPNLTPEKRRDYTDIIIKSSDQLLSIISDIVSIASIEAGQEKTKEDEININLICKLVNEQFSRNAATPNVTIRLHTLLSDDEATIVTDATKLTQILTNLVGNALKFTERGFVNFGYTVKNSQLEFYVEDSGIGIPSELHVEIFKRFRQVETNDARDYGGSGLGLAISKAYVEMLGGNMRLTSEFGKGSVFYFTLPYRKVTPRGFSDIPSVKGLNVEFEKQKTLLIAEDDDSNFMLLEELFSDIKINLIRAINGIEAVEKCKSNPQIDLVLMDIKMHEMDGFEATKQIKEFRPNLPIIAQTAYTSEDDRNIALACGCDDFVSKPLNTGILLKKINDRLHK